jgi:hypothetical protein
MSDKNEPDNSMREETDPYVRFLAAVRKATHNIGENMDGFVLCYCAKKINHPDQDRFPGIPDDQFLFTWGLGGTQAIVNNAYMEMAVNLLEQFLMNSRGNLYVAMQAMESSILQKYMARERQRKP